MWPSNLTVTLKNNRATLLCCFKLCASFDSHWSIQTKVTARKRSIRVKIGDFLSRVTLKFDGWPWKTIGYLFYVASSVLHHFIAIGEFKLELQSGNAQFESNRGFFVPCDLEIWRMTLKNNRAPLLTNIKLYASFHHHMWIQTGFTVRKRLSWVMTSVTLTFDLWPWPFAWTSHLSLVITSENFMMIQWWEHSQKGVTDRQTDRQTDGRTDCLVAAKNIVHTRTTWYLYTINFNTYVSDLPIPSFHRYHSVMFSVATSARIPKSHIPMQAVSRPTDKQCFSNDCWVGWEL